jgi:hypothetical protein
LPLAEERHAAALEAVNQQRMAMAQAEQRLHVEQANRSHAQRSLQIIASRRERLTLERQAMPAPDADEFADRQTELAELRERIGVLLESQQGQQLALPLLEQQRRTVLGEVQHAQKERAEANARRMALQQLQQRLQVNGKLDDWLRRHRAAARRTAVEVAARRSRLGRRRRSRPARAPECAAGEGRRPGVEQGSAGQQTDLLLPMADPGAVAVQR